MSWDVINGNIFYCGLKKDPIISLQREYLNKLKIKDNIEHIIWWMIADGTTALQTLH